MFAPAAFGAQVGIADSDQLVGALASAVAVIATAEAPVRIALHQRLVRRVARRRALVARWPFRRREVELRVAVAVLCFIGLPRGKMRERYWSRDRRIV
jgi:hypothetical protein